MTDYTNTLPTIPEDVALEGVAPEDVAVPEDDGVEYIIDHEGDRVPLADFLAANKG